MDTTTLYAIILALPEARQSAHFGNVDFRVREKIFASHPEPDRLVLKLTLEQQQMLVEADGAVFAPLANKWGQKGWTNATVAALDGPTAQSALRMAWLNVAPKSLAATLPKP